LLTFCANKTFNWSWTLPKGRSGGILLRANLGRFNVQNIVHGHFYLKLKLMTKSENFGWILIAVYGAAQEEEKDSFLRESVHVCAIQNQPLIVGGDFNIVRSSNEKKMIR
jgi:hypothetical protein